MVQENFKKVEKANWLKIIFNSAKFLISLLNVFAIIVSVCTGIPLVCTDFITLG